MLEGKVAIVTGASRGIGRAIALRLAAAGADALVHGTKEALLSALAGEVEAMGRRAAVVAGDVADAATAEAAVRLAGERFGAVDVLVNNAGINTAVLDAGDGAQ